MIDLHHNHHHHRLVFYSFLLLQWILSSHTVVARTCVAVPGPNTVDEYQCTDDPLLLTRAIDPKTGTQTSRYNLGLAQRVDGTDAEKKAIMDVLVRMDDYFINEVLAHPEYASVRNRW